MEITYILTFSICTRPKIGWIGKYRNWNQTKTNIFTCHVFILYLLEASKLIFPIVKTEIALGKMLLLPSKSSNRFVSEDVEGCVKCSSTWMPMFSFDTDVPQTGQIDKEGGRSMSWRYNSSRRLFISTDAIFDHANITVSIWISCFRFKKGLNEEQEEKSWNNNESLDDRDLPPVESHQALRSSLSIITRQDLFFGARGVSSCHAIYIKSVALQGQAYYLANLLSGKPIVVTNPKN